MRTFDQLTDTEKAKAEEHELTELLKAIAEGGLRFNDTLNHDDLQARIDTAFEKAQKMQTPWFANEYILDTCREDLEAMARPAAEDALYPEKGERISNAFQVK